MEEILKDKIENISFDKIPIQIVKYINIELFETKFIY